MDIKNYIQDSINTKTSILNDEKIIETIKKIADRIVEAYRLDKKVLTAGNGGSACDSQHIAGELVAKFFIDRPGLNAISLVNYISSLTATSNDYGYAKSFSRQIHLPTKEMYLLQSQLPATLKISLMLLKKQRTRE